MRDSVTSALRGLAENSGLAENNFGDTRGGGLAGPMGLFIILLMGVATVLLIRNMASRIRRLPAEFPDPAGAPPPGAAAGAAAAGAAAPEQEETSPGEPGQGPRQGDRPAGGQRLGGKPGGGKQPGGSRP
jgi:hypothetical protein